MTDFVIKGHICYSETKTEIRIVENGYLVCLAQMVKQLWLIVYGVQKKKEHLLCSEP